MRKWFILLMALVLMMGGCACAETAVLSQQCQLIKQAEAAIQEKYGLTPEI